MGQKINPTGFRLAVNKNWSSRWYSNTKNFAGLLNNDIKVREFLNKKLVNAAVSRILIERPAKNAKITIFSARPGIVIGKKGEDIESLRSSIQDLMGIPVQLNIEEVRKPEIDATLIAQSIAQQLEKRVMFRRAMKRAMQNAMRLGAQGIKIMSSGRLNGIEIARSEWYREGRVPLHTLRADVDYGTARAQTQYGIIGVKVWVFKGEIFEDPTLPKTATESQVEKTEEIEKPKKTIKSAVKKSKLQTETKKPEVTIKKKDEVKTRTYSNKQRRELKMLQPTRQKYRKQHKGRNKGLALTGNKVSFGDFGLKATGRGRITARQIEAARRVMTRHIKRGGRIWIRIFPDKPITKKPAEVRMGKGKGSVEYYVAEIQPGKMLYEMDGVDEATAKEAFRLASAKLPLLTKFASRHIGG